VVHREKQTDSTQDRTALGVQVSSRRPIGMSTGQARRTCLLNSGLLEKGVWCESTAFRQPLPATTHARVVQREPSAL